MRIAITGGRHSWYASRMLADAAAPLSPPDIDLLPYLDS